jgi:hypothetical protein
MAAPARLQIIVDADTKGVASAFSEVQSQSGKIAGFANTASNVMFGAVAAIGAVGATTIKSAEEAAAATAGLETVFASMGDTTGEAAESAIAYAEAMSKKIGVDDDAIIAAQTQLATFSAVSDETARAAGIFDRTTTAAADLAAAGFGSMDSNAVQLGKALQDPINGLSALARSGVTFTESQKAQIAAMVEAGEVTEAQTLVLAAIEKQVGGTAEATATGSEKMQVAFGEVQEQIGTALLPAFTSIAEVILNKVIPAIQPMLDFFMRHSDIILPLAGILLGVAVALKVVAVAQGIWNAVLLASPLTWIVVGIVALIAAIVLLIANWDKIVAATKRAWAAITEAIGDAWETIKGWFTDLPEKILGVFTNAHRWLYNIGKEIIGGLWDGLKDMWGNVTSWVSGLGKKIADLKGPPAKDAQLLVGAGRLIMGGLQTGLQSGWSGVAGYLGSRNVAIAGAMSGGVGFGASTVNINVTTTGLGADAPELQRAVVNALRGYTSRNGPLDIPVRDF